MKKASAAVKQSVNAPKARPKRRTQVERSAATRQLVLDAAIKCLFTHGYGTTTTILVSEVAGVSRGAMLHQFPSKADLMTFVVEAVFEEDLLLYQRLLKAAVEPRDRLLAYAHAAWELTSRPAGVAILEIFQGSRSDPVLAEKLAPVQERINATAVSTLEKELHRAPSIPLMQLVVAVARGFTVSGLMSPTLGNGEEAMELFRQLLDAGIERGIILPEGKKRRTRRRSDQ